MLFNFRVINDYSCIEILDFMRCNLGIICGPGSIVVLGSFTDPYSSHDSIFAVFLFFCFQKVIGVSLEEMNYLFC